MFPDTSRAMRTGEVDGQEYYFVSRSVMENDILNKRFVTIPRVFQFYHVVLVVPVNFLSMKIL